MPTIRRQFRDQYDQLLARAKAAGQPVKIEDLVRVWAATNYDSLVSVAFRIMREPVNTIFSIPPLSFTAFTSETARDNYHMTLFDEIKRTQKGEVTPHRIACLHVEKIVIWCSAQVKDQLAELAVDASPIYESDAVATEHIAMKGQC